jgi:hypothetical protein
VSACHSRPTVLNTDILCSHQIDLAGWFCAGSRVWCAYMHGSVRGAEEHNTMCEAIILQQLSVFRYLKSKTKQKQPRKRQLKQPIVNVPTNLRIQGLQTSQILQRQLQLTTHWQLMLPSRGPNNHQIPEMSRCATQTNPPGIHRSADKSECYTKVIDKEFRNGPNAPGRKPSKFACCELIGAACTSEQLKSFGA